jgi:hypothetical protein
MNDTIKLILILFLLIGSFIILSNNSYLKKFILKIKLKDYIKLSKYDEFNLYSFLEIKYKNILLPKNIIFTEEDNYFICKNLKFLSNNKEISIKIKFKPLIDNSFITKYKFFEKYGYFEIIEDIISNSDVPEIDHLSSDKSDDLNFDINDIINSDNSDSKSENLKNKSSEDIFLKNIENNDTENDTTESIINNVL